MLPEQYNWDFFIAYASADKQAAEKLYDYLKPKSRVFIDSRNIDPGDDWDIKLRRAQKTSLMTIVVISLNTEVAYYAREEIALAIAFARENAEKHRVVPVFLDPEARSNESGLYGLTLKQGLTISHELSLKMVADRLLDLLSRLTKDTRNGQEPISETTDRTGKETSSRTIQYDFPENLIDFDDQRDLFTKMLDSPKKRLMFIQAPDGRGKTSLLRMLEFHSKQAGIACCSIDFRGQPYDNPHLTLAPVICVQLGLSPRHLANALRGFSGYKHDGEIDDPYVVSQILAGVSVTHEGLRQRHIKELLKNAFLADLAQFVEQKGRVVCLFDSFERLSEEEEDWLLDTLLRPVERGQLQGVMIVTAGCRWPKVPRWEWEQNTHLLDGLPLMKEEHIKIYAEKVNIEISDEDARSYWKASQGGIPYYMAMVIHNVKELGDR